MHTIIRASLAVGSLVAAQVAGIAIASAAEPKVKGLDVLGTVGYGTTNDDDDPPFGVMLGVDAGYTFRFGLRLGLGYAHGFGREIVETRNGIGGVQSQVRRYQSDFVGASVGYDWLINPIRLRASIDQGIVFINADKVADVRAATYFVNLGIAAFWHFGPLEAGAGLKYYWLAGGGLGFSGALMAGGRF